MNAMWQELQELDPATRHDCLTAIEAFLALHPQAALDHEPDWLAAQSLDGTKGVKYFVCLGEGGAVVAVAPFLVHASRLSIDLAHVTLASLRIRRYSLCGGPLFAGALGGDTTLAAGLLSAVAAQLGPRDLPFCLGLELATPFAKALQTHARRWGFFLMPRGESYHRRLIALPATFDQYMGALGPKTRQDLRRQERRLEREAGPVTWRFYCDPREVDEFLDLAGRLSRRTYQWNLLRMGVADTDRARHALTVAAAHGWLRSCILFCGEEPAAFMHGYLHKRTYYSRLIGYDPRWAEWSPGHALHLRIVRHLIDGNHADHFDFMYGDNSTKERLSNRSRLEQNVYVVPATIKWRLIAGVLVGSTSFLQSARRLLDRYGITSSLRRYLRRRAMSGVKGA